MEPQTEQKLKEVLELLRQGKPFEARKILEILFEKVLDCPEVVLTNRYNTFWCDAINRLGKIDDFLEKSECILAEWRTFQSHFSDSQEKFEPALDAVQSGYFYNALNFFKDREDEKDSYQKAENYRKIGICYKKLGDFENARTYLTEANRIYPNLSPVLAELADCYSLCGEDKIGKVLFREAFFVSPDEIDLDFLDSELIKCLIKITSEKGYSGKSAQYWIPVYGVLTGVFNIKKELSSQEVAKLKKDIYALENETKDPSCNREILVPRLLNCYFWLLDFYALSRENNSKISEILLKIKILDSSIYDAYIG